ncbi:MAG: peptidylprolyl isomerase [Pseudomonadota bacterium]
MKTNTALAAVVGAFAALWTAPAFSDALEGKMSPADVLDATTAEDWRMISPENLLVIQVESGQAVVALSPVLASENMAQIKRLASEGFYDGLSFYRVIDGFVAQGGDLFDERGETFKVQPLSAQFDEKVSMETLSFFRLKDGDGYAPEIGFVASLPTGLDRDQSTAWHLHCTGAFALGRNNERDSAGSEFYITLQPQRYLDRNLTVLGRVIYGMDVIQRLPRVAPASSRDEYLGETIISMRMMSDLPAAEQTAFEILHSESPAFAKLAEARRNRPEAFFYHRPDHLDVCALPVPVRIIEAGRISDNSAEEGGE